jgi:hypothetical protein
LDLKGYFDYYRKEAPTIDDDDDDDDDAAYEIEEEGKRDFEPVELDVEIVDINYKFSPVLMDWLLSHTDGTTTANRTWAERLVAAGKSGNLEYIMWMRVTVAEMDQIVMSVFAFVKEVAYNGHRHVLEWLQTEYGTFFATSIPAYIAERRPVICIEALALGHLNILQWWFSNGLHIDLETCILAALSGDRLDVLILLKREYEHLSPDFWGSCKYDFSHKSLESSCDIFQWVHLNGCPWSDRTYKKLKSHQIKDEYKDRRKWAFENGCCRIRGPPEQEADVKQEADVEQQAEEEQEHDVEKEDVEQEENVERKDEDEQGDEAVQEVDVEQGDDAVQEVDVEQGDEAVQEVDVQQEGEAVQEVDVQQGEKDDQEDEDEESYRRKRKRNMRSVWMNMN